MKTVQIWSRRELWFTDSTKQEGTVKPGEWNNILTSLVANGGYTWIGGTEGIQGELSKSEIEKYFE
jgi:hypothetical protein